jgi:hypothetical protein
MATDGLIEMNSKLLRHFGIRTLTINSSANVICLGLVVRRHGYAYRNPRYPDQIVDQYRSSGRSCRIYNWLPSLLPQILHQPP